jgi:hypothetical protein
LEKSAHVLTALKYLKEQQDQLAGDPSDVYSSLMTKLFKVDTIPFMIYTDEPPSPFYAEDPLDTEYYKTFCFRLESLDELANTAIVSLLKPFNVYGELVSNINDVYFAKRTTTFLTLDLIKFTSVKCLDIELLKREIIMEPKW